MVKLRAATRNKGLISGIWEEYSFLWLVCTHPSAPLSQAVSKLCSLPVGGQAGCPSSRHPFSEKKEALPFGFQIHRLPGSPEQLWLPPILPLPAASPKSLLNSSAVMWNVCYTFLCVIFMWNVRLSPHSNDGVDGPGQSWVAQMLIPAHPLRLCKLGTRRHLCNDFPHLCKQGGCTRQSARSFIALITLDYVFH